MILLRLVITVFGLSCFINAAAQDILSTKLDGTEKGKSVLAFVQVLEQKPNVNFYYHPSWIENIFFTESHQGQTLGEALDQLFMGTDLTYIRMYENSIVFVKDPTQALRRNRILQTAIIQKKKLQQYQFGQSDKIKKGAVVIRGRVTDFKTREALPLANIQVSDSQDGTATDNTGNFTLSLTPGAYVLNFSFIDYESIVIDLVAYDDGVLDVELEKVPFMLDEIIIQDQQSRELTTNRIGQIQLTMRELRRAPALLGEADLIRQVQNLPGVTTVGEAASGFNVRGGSVDQNLILYDGVPAFNSSHVFGFLSAFNSEAIRDVSFYRGGIPAEYGGRVSSVLDIQSRDGSFEKWNMKAGIGMITSNVLVDGPIQKDKTSLAASFRSTYSNWLVRSIRTDYADLRNSAVSFYDGTLKLTHLVNDRIKLSATGYASKDGFRLMGDTTFQWSNIQGSVKLNYQITPQLSSEFVVGSSSYGYQVINDNELTASTLSYRITSSVAKAGFHYHYNKHKLNFGWQLVHYGFRPGNLEPNSSTSNAVELSLDKQYSVENAFYVSDEWQWNEKISIEAGIRLATFTSFGPATLSLYEPGIPKEINTIIGEREVGRLEGIKTYTGLEPRLSLRWTTGPTSSIKAGFNRMNQFLHLVTNTAAVTPVDIWQPSGYYFKPQIVQQVSLGYFRDFKAKQYGTSVEAFYKDMDNILDFKDGAQLILNKNLEVDLLQGKGYSYGIETLLSKYTGRFTGSFNYTYSRTFRTIAGPTSSESINSGNRYPANFDQPHILNFSWKYNLSRRHFFTGNFTYHTGRPVTIPLSAFQVENTTVAYFSQRNQYRIPEYHRMDVALVIEGNHKRKKRFEGTWVFSVYNVYGRKNPYTIFFRPDAKGIPRPYQLAIIGTMLPSVSYNVKI